MGKITVNNFGKGGSIAKTASPNGLSTMNVQSAPKGVNPNKGYPASANVSGDQGASPGIGNKGIGSFSTPKSAANVHLGQAGSGHVQSMTTKATQTGFGNIHSSLKAMFKGGK